MRRRLSILAAFALAAPAPARALELPARVPVDLHGRLETVVEVERASTPFPWDHASRSPLARTRLMTSLGAGSDRTGRLYVEGAARWNDVAAGEDRAHLEFEQGDYVWRASGSTPHTLRLFANERRYFIGSLAPAVLDDDRIERYRSHGGARVDGARGRVQWTALGSLLDDGSSRARRLAYASARWNGGAAQARLSCLSDHRGPSGAETHAIVDAEAAGFYRRLTLIASYRQSGFDHRAVFFPSGSFDFDGYVGSNFVESLPAAAAAFGEARLGDLPLRTWGHVDVVARYAATGAGYFNDLAQSPPGTIRSSAGVFFRHDAVAADGRVVYERTTRFQVIDTRSERLLTHGRAFLKNGAEVLLRGAVGFREDERAHRRNENFVHAAVSRSMKKLEAGVHAMAKDIDDGDFEQRFAVEARLNWSANLSLYGRVISADAAGSRDAEFWRLEMRPANHVFVTFGYGRRSVGDAPYVLEDADIDAMGHDDAVYAVTVRGDF